MRSNTDFKILLDPLESTLVFSVDHLLAAGCVFDCPGFVHDTELLNKVLLFLSAKL